MVYPQWWDKDPHGKYERKVDFGSLHMFEKQDNQKREWGTIDAQGVYHKKGGDFGVDLARGSPQYPDIAGDQDLSANYYDRVGVPGLVDGYNAGYITDKNAILRGLRTDLYIPSQPRPSKSVVEDGAMVQTMFGPKPYREIAHPATANFRPPHGKGPQGPSKPGAHNGKNSYV